MEVDRNNCNDKYQGLEESVLMSDIVSTMAEAKERTLTPAISSDIQAILKRCENLEKEVRSLKLNLALMNRKDSEQTKQIEELQKQNEELGEQKERLLEEIERIISETGKMRYTIDSAVLAYWGSTKFVAYKARSIKALELGA
ncbi:hypothetical protein RJ640_001639 [Escallonia rubra]|uniref:Uncharacterized protein n=1 Tax=Escallonia rubra TaxID=112253 RepID=A0AA88QY06_9ASTE|nr:hypothetical protein RJ640_001639 [Escallonia rubra]